MAEKWLSMNEAAEILGIHADTLRRWADTGKIAVFKTPGGHRRFSEPEIRSFGRQRLRFQIEAGLRDVLTRRAIKHTREEVAQHSSEPWLARMTEEQRNASRQLGHDLMSLTVEFLTSDRSEEHLNRAREIGSLYGDEGLLMGLPLAQMMRASTFFRDSMVETIVALPEDVADSRLTATLLLKMNEVLDAVQLGVVDRYGS